MGSVGLVVLRGAGLITSVFKGAVDVWARSGVCVFDPSVWGVLSRRTCAGRVRVCVWPPGATAEKKGGSSPSPAPGRRVTDTGRSDLDPRWGGGRSKPPPHRDSNSPPPRRLCDVPALSQATSYAGVGPGGRDGRRADVAFLNDHRDTRPPSRPLPLACRTSCEVIPLRSAGDTRRGGRH